MAQVPSEIADRLYAAPPDTFITERDDAVAAARAAGDSDLATAIGRLRKPTVAAWLVNLLALRRPDLVAELAELSAHLRTAQRELRGTELRELSAQRRAVVAGLVNEVRSLAEAQTHRPRAAGPKLPLAEVEATLTAALIDQEVAEQVRSGRLLRTTGYTGFGEVPRPKLHLVTGTAPAGTQATQETGQGSGDRRDAGGRDAGDPDTGDGRAAGPRQAAGEQPAGGGPPEGGGQRGSGARRRAAEQWRARQEQDEARQVVARQRTEAQQAMAQAQTAQQEADAALAQAVAGEQDGAGELAGLEAELAELTRRRSATEAELSRRKLARKAAQRAVSAARRRLGEAQAALEALPGEAAAEPARQEPEVDTLVERRPDGRGRRSAG